MSGFSFEDAGKGRFLLKGRLGYTTATQALEQAVRLFAGHKKLELDLGGVEGTDSAGLALLVEWTGWARREKVKLVFKHVPEQVLALARISEVEKLLPIR